MAQTTAVNIWRWNVFRRISGHHQRGAGGANKRVTRGGVGDHDLRCGGKYLRPRIEHQKFFERARGFTHP